MGHPSKYPDEFRREAVALYRSSERSEVARSLGISDGSLAAWVVAGSVLVIVVVGLMGGRR